MACSVGEVLGDVDFDRDVLQDLTFLFLSELSKLEPGGDYTTPLCELEGVFVPDLEGRQRSDKEGSAPSGGFFLPSFISLTDCTL